MKNTGFVFISGAGLSASIWDDVRVKIDAPTLAIEAPERGSKAALKLTFKDYVDEAMNQIEAFPPKKIILVGHSIGGVVMMQLAQLLGKRVIGIIGVGAGIPRPGESFLSCLPQPQRTVLGLVMRLAGTAVPESSIRKSLCSSLTTEQSDVIVKNFTPEARALYTTGISGKPYTGKAHYVVLTDDREFTADFQRSMAERLNAKTTEIHGGHLSMINHADEVAKTVAAFAADL